MNLFYTISFLLLVLLLSGSSCAIQPSDTTISREVKNLTAFSKIYGYVKYFHPSDEAREIDWNRLAVLGVRAVKNAENDTELNEVLDSLFLPLAPTIEISEIEPDNRFFLSEYLEKVGRDTSGLKTIAWQHLGVNQGDQKNVYKSLRTNKSNEAMYVFQNLPAKPLQGKRISFHGSLKIKDIIEEAYGELVLRVDGLNRQPLAIKNMTDRPVLSDKWNSYKLESEVSKNAQSISIGFRLNGTGKLWVDDLKLLVKNDRAWDTVSIAKQGFEESTENVSNNWASVSDGFYTAELDTSTFVEGNSSLKLMSSSNVLPDGLPKIGETTTEKIAENLWCRIPLALLGNSTHTLPRADSAAFASLKSELERVTLGQKTANDMDVRLADIVVAWNELQHFYPYFDVIETDWEAQLSLSLEKALADSTQQEFNATLNRMFASTRDGHIRLRHPSINNSNAAGLPFLVDWIENKVVVTHSLHEQIQPGAIVISVDGEPATKLVQDRIKQIPGSSQLSLFRSLRHLGAGESGTEASVEIQRKDNVKMYMVPRSSRHSTRKLEKNHLPVTGQLRDGIYYVDLNRAPMSRINDEMDQIASSRGVIFDMRGYPYRNHEVIRHLLTRPDTSDQWMQIPKISYPDQKNIIGYQKSGWHLTPAKPHIRGEVVFITDARAISYAESVMSFVEHYNLGEIVGQPTAGTNGNVNRTVLPGGYRFGWTGMKVVKHDGSQHHLAGIQPTVPVKKTIRGVREGKDEFLEKAIQVLQ